MSENVRAPMCGDCFYCTACKIMNLGRAIRINGVFPLDENFEAAPVGDCTRFTPIHGNTRVKDKDAEIADLKKALDAQRARYAELKMEFDDKCAKGIELHDQLDAATKERDELVEKLKYLSRKNSEMGAQLDIVHLIFGEK